MILSQSFDTTELKQEVFFCITHYHGILETYNVAAASGNQCQSVVDINSSAVLH